MTDEKSRFSHTREQTQFARRLRRDVSKTERKLWSHLKSGKMGAPFRRQHPIDRYFADYCCVPLMLVVEVDGHTHSTTRDSVRDFRMGEIGYDVLRFSVQEIDENLAGVLATIHGAVQMRLQRLDALRE